MIKTEVVQCFLGRALRLNNGTIEVTVTLDVGPRIIGLQRVGGFNVMFEDVDGCVNKDCSQVYGEGKKWHIYGGHRLWLSPESLSTYYPDNLPVEYSITESGAVFTPPRWQTADIQPSIEISLSGENGLTVRHEVVNLGEKRRFALWALTVLKSGGVLTVPLSTEDTGFLANRNLVLWPYSMLDDKRFKFEQDRIVLFSDKSAEKPFKFGTLLGDREIFYRLEQGEQKCTFVKKTAQYKSGDFPDMSCDFESYCSSLIHEMETLSPLQTVDRGERIVHTEEWRLLLDF